MKLRKLIEKLEEIEQESYTDFDAVFCDEKQPIADHGALGFGIRRFEIKVGVIGNDHNFVSLEEFDKARWDSIVDTVGFIVK